MTAALAIERKCSACRRGADDVEFRGADNYCRECRAAYQRAYYRAKTYGLPMAEWRPWRLRGQSHLRVVRDVSDARASLDEVINYLFLDLGFTGVVAELEEAKRRLTARNRRAVEAEGWVV